MPPWKALQTSTTDHKPLGKPHKPPQQPIRPPKNEPLSPQCPTPTGEAKNPPITNAIRERKRPHQKEASAAQRPNQKQAPTGRSEPKAQRQQANRHQRPALMAQPLFLSRSIIIMRLRRDFCSSSSVDCSSWVSSNLPSKKAGFLVSLKSWVPSARLTM